MVARRRVRAHADGAVGTVVGGILSLIPLIVMGDQDAALRVSFAIMMVTVVWLLSWVLAGGIRAQHSLVRPSVLEPLGAGAPQL